MAKRTPRHARHSFLLLSPGAALLAAALVGAPAPARAEDAKYEKPLILQQGVLKGTTLNAAQKGVSVGGKNEAGPQPEPPTKPLPAVQNAIQKPLQPKPALPHGGTNKGGPQPEPPTVGKKLIHGPGALPSSHERPAGLEPSRLRGKAGPAGSLRGTGVSRRSLGGTPVGSEHAARAVEGSLLLVSGPSGCLRPPRELSVEMSRAQDIPHPSDLVLRPAAGGAPAARLRVSRYGRELRTELGLAHAVPGGEYVAVVEDEHGQLVAGSVRIRVCSTGSLTVRVAMEGCSIAADELIVEAWPWPARYVPRYPLPPVAGGSDLELVYRRDDIPAQTWRVRPRLPSGRCPGGTWSRELGVEVEDGGSHEMNFRYSVGAEETRISASQVADQIEIALSGIEIRLNNYDPSRRGNSRFLAGDAFLDMPDHLGGRRSGIRVPEQRSGAFKYYVRDLNKTGHNVIVDGDTFRVRFAFESSGSEIKGHCFGGFSDGCVVGTDDTAPDGNLDNLMIDVSLRPIRFTPAGGGPTGVTFEVTDLRMSFDLELNGLATGLGGLVGALVRERVLPATRDRVSQSISGFETRRQIASQLRPILDEAEVGDVQSVEISGNDLVLHHRQAG